ncbi:Protein of unknown function (DUF1676) [Nesidiocoris tenuis]|uniref:Protein osiris 14 n=1 Tax=Nesidiocoris tenuis TaxID=355587 RepID=A0ABN7AWF0_9HEMI|nr:Protein of unknown function (DUF1676) [Nesidiocoris tenuis]
MTGSYLFVLLVVPALTFAAVADNRIEDSTSSLADCSSRPDVTTCLGARAIATLDRAARMNDIPLFEGVTLVKENDFRAGRALMTPEQIEESLPENNEERSNRLLDLAYDSALRFLQSHSLQLKMPRDAPETFQRALDEGRAKLKKKILPIAMLVGAKLVTLLPLALGAIGLMAIKALFIGKIALVIAAILAFQKFFTGGGAGIGGFAKAPAADWNSGSSGWASNSYSGSGPYRRSMEAHNLAYSGQQPAEFQPVESNAQ